MWSVEREIPFRRPWGKFEGTEQVSVRERKILESLLGLDTLINFVDTSCIFEAASYDFRGNAYVDWGLE